MLTDQQVEAMELMISQPHLTQVQIAAKVGISERSLYRWRQTQEWKDEWDRRDKQDMIDHLRTQAISSGNAQLFRTYFEVTGRLDDEMIAKMLRMDEEEAKEIARHCARWFLRTAEGARFSEAGSVESP